MTTASRLEAAEERPQPPESEVRSQQFEAKEIGQLPYFVLLASYFKLEVTGFSNLLE
jgi:hypothetical protein